MRIARRILVILAVVLTVAFIAIYWMTPVAMSFYSSTEAIPVTRVLPADLRTIQYRRLMERSSHTWDMTLRCLGATSTNPKPNSFQRTNLTRRWLVFIFVQACNSSYSRVRHTPSMTSSPKKSKWCQLDLLRHLEPEPQHPTTSSWKEFSNFLRTRSHTGQQRQRFSLVSRLYFWRSQLSQRDLRRPVFSTCIAQPTKDSNRATPMIHKRPKTAYF